MSEPSDPYRFHCRGNDLFHLILCPPSNILGHEDPPIGRWRFSGAKLKEIGKLFGISVSGVNRACGRLENMMERDKDLRGKAAVDGMG